MGWSPPAPPPLRLRRQIERVLEPAQLWRCECAGCGAPLQIEQLQCSYCRRATGQTVKGAREALGLPRVSDTYLDVTTFGDAEPRVMNVRTGLISINEALRASWAGPR